MTIDEAIQILSADETDCHPDTNPEVNEATKLGIEALKRIKEGRQGYNQSIVRQLPEETIRKVFK